MEAWVGMGRFPTKGQRQLLLRPTHLAECIREGVTQISRAPFGSYNLSPHGAKEGPSVGGYTAQEAGGQTGRHAWCWDRAAALDSTPISPDLAHSGICPLLPVGMGCQGCAREGRSAQGSMPLLPKARISPCLPSAVCSELAGPWRRREGSNCGPSQRVPLPTSRPQQYLLRPRLRRSPQARILFWASMCVRLPVFSPSMLSTQSPTATPA